MNTNDYLSQVQEVFSRRGWTRNVSPASMLNEWTSFVDWCKQGYSQNIYEYYNDIRVREWIELILSAPELGKFRELKEFAANVNRIDKMFRTLLLPNVSIPERSYWWEQGVLRYAGKEYANDIYHSYGIEIEVVS